MGLDLDHYFMILMGAHPYLIVSSTPDAKLSVFKVRSETKPEIRLREKVVELWLLLVASYFCPLTILICCTKMSSAGHSSNFLQTFHFSLLLGSA